MIESNEYGSFGDCTIPCDKCLARYIGCKYFMEIISELREYKQAEKDGTIIRLPCKVGDKIYRIKYCFSYYKTPVEHTVSGFSKWDNEELMILLTDGTRVSQSRIGDTVFLSPEEAEAKLKEIKGE